MSETIRVGVIGAGANTRLHHIPRLMVLGNWAAQRGYDPDALTEGFQTRFVDGYDWVMPANVVGMSQHADGGAMATKPYVSGGAYIDRMSDYCSGCHYDKKQKVGERACPYNALYWDFFARNEGTLGNNFRLGMVYLSAIDGRGFPGGNRLDRTDRLTARHQPV